MVHTSVNKQLLSAALTPIMRGPAPPFRICSQSSKGNIYALHTTTPASEVTRLTFALRVTFQHHIAVRNVHA